MLRSKIKTKRKNVKLKQRGVYYFGLPAAVALFLFGMLMINPTITPSSNALDCGGTECGDGYTMSRASTSLSAEVASVVSLSTTAAVNVDIVPKSTGSFASSTTKVRVNTNNTSGFSVYMQTVGDNNDLVSSDKTITASINPVAANTPAESFGANTWGYKLTTSGDTTNTYNPVSTTATNPILKEDRVSVASGNTYDLTFGINIDTTLPAGQYTNSVLLSAVANPITITSLHQLTYMQDMTSDICNNTKDYVDVNNYVTKQLIDLRDGKSYWVAKLADGNCWMTQNLALDLDPAKTLTSADTDLPSGESWTPTSKTNEHLEAIANDYLTQYSWSQPGMLLSTPLEATDCNTYGHLIGAKLSDKLSDVCASSGFIDVSGSDWQPTFTAQMGDYQYNAATNSITATPNANGATFIAVDTAAKTYDARYLAGNYYQFAAASATSDNNLTEKGKDATSSICPKNWGLPRSGAQNDNGYPSMDNDFYQLLYAYGYPVPSSSTYFDFSGSGGNNIPYTLAIGSKENVASNIAAPPMSFAMGGFVSGAGTYRYPGSGSLHWSKTVFDDRYAYYFLHWPEERLFPSYFDYRFYGFQVRCLAR